MGSTPQLTGHVDDRDDIIEGLREKNRRLDEALRLERLKVGQSEAGVRELKRVLTPLYRALQAVFGEIDAMDIQDAGPAASPVATQAWDVWKSRLGPACAKVISALQVQPGMTQTQIGIATGMGNNNMPTYISRLNKAGLINKNGKHISLKQL